MDVTREQDLTFFVQAQGVLAHMISMLCRRTTFLNVYDNDHERDSHERIFRQLGIEKACHLVGYR